MPVCDPYQSLLDRKDRIFSDFKRKGMLTVWGERTVGSACRLCSPIMGGRAWEDT